MRGWSSQAALTRVQLHPAAHTEPGAPSRERRHRAPGVPGLDSHNGWETLSSLKREHRPCQRMTPPGIRGRHTGMHHPLVLSEAETSQTGFTRAPRGPFHERASRSGPTSDASPAQLSRVWRNLVILFPKSATELVCSCLKGTSMALAD